MPTAKAKKAAKKTPAKRKKVFRTIHETPVRSSSGVRGVTYSRACWCAVWYDPPMHRNVVYCGPGEEGFQEAVRIRQKAERAIKAGASNR